MTAVAPHQRNLFAGGPVGARPGVAFERVDLGRGAWVDVARGWFGGADDVAAELMAGVAWRRHTRWMYDREVEEPRLSRWFGVDESLPHEALAAFRVAAGRRYGIRFGAVGLNYYRDGSDSVAFHADRELRHLDDTLVAVLTFGSTRPFLLRPAGGGPSIDLRPASGDLLVMGGTCQELWEHAVPKVPRGAGPRVSASVRWARRSGFEARWADPEWLRGTAGRRLDDATPRQSVRMGKYGSMSDVPEPTPPIPRTTAGLDERGKVKTTRAGVVWAGVTAAAVLLILLVIFIAQNSQDVSVHYLGARGRVSLAVALLIAAVVGVLILAVPSAARIFQLRKSLKKHAAAAAAAAAAPPRA